MTLDDFMFNIDKLIFLLNKYIYEQDYLQIKLSIKYIVSIFS